MKTAAIILTFCFVFTGLSLSGQTFKPSPPPKVKTEIDEPVNPRINQSLQDNVKRLRDEALGSMESVKPQGENRCARYKDVVCIRKENDLTD